MSGGIIPDKKIRSVEAASGSYRVEAACGWHRGPCQYNVTITYTDDTSAQTKANGQEIAKEYFNYLDEESKKHFAKYLSQSSSESDQELDTTNAYGRANKM